MLSDVLAWAEFRPTGKIVSKETLNHPGLIARVTGLDPYLDTPKAYAQAYEALGIDLINRVPTENAPPSTPPGKIRPMPHHEDYLLSHLGVYDSAMRTKYPCKTHEDIWELDLSTYDDHDLVVPVPHPNKANDIRARQEAIGEIGLYYPMLYTTLFMWAVEMLGWEVFLVGAALEPERFFEHFLKPSAEKSKKIIQEIIAANFSPFLFVHDDLADSNGPIFRPDWYECYLFPLYREILEPAFHADKKVILVADGNMTAFLPRLREIGIMGIMYESPATSVEAVLEHFSDGYLIGGIDTGLLTRGEPATIHRHVLELAEKTEDVPGFAISSCGGLHGNIPLTNLEVYFDTRVEIGATPEDWRSSHHF